METLEPTVRVSDDLLHERAQQMRDNPTTSELIALMKIRDKYEFEHQFVFGFYILDFVIPSKLLIIELDGGAHTFRKDYDERRDNFCRTRKMNVLRVPNVQAQNIVALIEKFPDVENWKTRWRTITRYTVQRKDKRRREQNMTAEQRAQRLIERRENRKPRRVKPQVSVEEHNAKIREQIRALEAQLK